MAFDSTLLNRHWLTEEQALLPCSVAACDVICCTKPNTCWGLKIKKAEWSSQALLYVMSAILHWFLQMFTLHFKNVIHFHVWHLWLHLKINVVHDDSSCTKWLSTNVWLWLKVISIMKSTSVCMWGMQLNQRISQVDKSSAVIFFFFFPNICISRPLWDLLKNMPPKN